MNKKLLPIFLTFLLILSPVSAQSLFREWYEWLNIPEDYSTFPNLFYFVLLPFLGTFTIIWGILTNLKIFKLRKVNVLLSLIFAFSLLYSGILLAITFYLFQIGGFFGVLVFFVLFIVLTSLYSYRRIGEDYIKTKELHEEITEKGLKDTIKVKEKGLKNLEKIRKKEEKLNKDLEKINDVIEASLEHIEIIRDPTTSFIELKERYGTDQRGKAAEKVLKVLKKQKDKKILILKELKKLAKAKKKLQSV